MMHRASVVAVHEDHGRPLYRYECDSCVYKGRITFRDQRSSYGIRAMLAANRHEDRNKS